MSQINFREAQFLLSAPNLSKCPPEEGAEVAFAGRSNAGKSSAINTLTQNKKLARTSKTPGRTQLINYFSVGDNVQQRLVDLPGYGYAKVPMKIKKRWQEDLSQYLQERRTLRGLVIVMDVRHPLQDFDTMMLNWATEADMPVHLLLTKSDKLKKGPAKSTLLAVEKHMRDAGVDDLVTAQLFSSLKDDGVKQLKSVLQSWLLTPKVLDDVDVDVDVDEGSNEDKDVEGTP